MTVSGSGGEIEKALQWVVDAAEVDPAPERCQFLEDRDQSSRTGTCEESHCTEVDTDQSMIGRPCGAGFPREGRTAFFVELAFDGEHQAPTG